jgi:NADP-dependent 3-hydroxy acid dehydrogenase YdfG
VAHDRVTRRRARLVPGGGCARSRSAGQRDGFDDRNAAAERTGPADALAPEQVAQLITWIAAAPPGLVLNEVTVTPLFEQGWP